MRYTIIIASLLLLTHSDSSAEVKPSGQETVIHILVVKDPDVSQTQVNAHLDFLRDTWANTDFSGVAPTTIEFVAGGTAVDIPGFVLSGTYQAQIEEVKDFVNSGNPTLREREAADVVIAFTTFIEGWPLCGIAPQDNWIKNDNNPDAPEFVEDANGLDLRGKDDQPGSPGFYVALVATDFPCDSLSDRFYTAHEFGHLFGGGHHDLDEGETDPHQWLFLDSRAFAWVGKGRAGIKKVSALGEEFPSFCQDESTPELDTCARSARYSWKASENRNNARAIDKTARSVANYMAGVPASGTGGTGGTPAQCEDGLDNDGDGLVDLPDPGCDTATDDNETDSPPPPPAEEGCDPAAYVPVNVTASLRETCVPGTSQSSYTVRWDHACFGGIYEGWATTSGITYYVGETTAQSTIATVEGPPSTSYLRIRACNSTFCSALSSPAVPLTDFC